MEQEKEIKELEKRIEKFIVEETMNFLKLNNKFSTVNTTFVEISNKEIKECETLLYNYLDKIVEPYRENFTIYYKIKHIGTKMDYTGFFTLKYEIFTSVNHKIKNNYVILSAYEENLDIGRIEIENGEYTLKR